jgi:lipopolysaccharide assembly protein A
MQFLRTMFWVVLAVLGVIFSFNNWQIVSIKLWGDILVDTPLPVLLFVTFMLGLLPVLILHRATRWNLRRKLEAANRSLSESLTPTPEPPRHDLTAMNPPGAL